jgi:hypothetical protein
VQVVSAELKKRIAEKNLTAENVSTAWLLLLQRRLSEGSTRLLTCLTFK